MRDLGFCRGIEEFAQGYGQSVLGNEDRGGAHSESTLPVLAEGWVRRRTEGGACLLVGEEEGPAG